MMENLITICANALPVRNIFNEDRTRRSLLTFGRLVLGLGLAQSLVQVLGTRHLEVVVVMSGQVFHVIMDVEAAAVAIIHVLVAKAYVFNMELLIIPLRLTFMPESLSSRLYCK